MVPPQNPLARMSALALSSWLSEAKTRDSHSRGWISGYRVASGQTSARSFPVKSFTSLCQRMGKAPSGQFRAWLMEKVLLHSHLVGNFSGIHPYLRHKASWNAPLWSTNPWCSSGTVVSQFDAPLSLTSLAVLECMLNISLMKVLTAIIVSPICIYTTSCTSPLISVLRTRCANHIYPLAHQWCATILVCRDTTFFTVLPLY